jgi:hypothetical protein
MKYVMLLLFVFSLTAQADQTVCNQRGNNTVCNTFHIDGSMDQAVGHTNDQGTTTVWNNTRDATGTNGGPYNDYN